MKRVKKTTGILLAAMLAAGYMGCGWAEEAGTAQAAEAEAAEPVEALADGENGADVETAESQDLGSGETGQVNTSLAKIDSAKWNYNEEDNVYWQVGISYCENPADASCETLGIYVPGDYMTAAANGDGTYTCEMNREASVQGYTAETAPIVIPVNTPGYAAMAAPVGYTSEAADYTDSGFVYVYAGCRGRDAGAPAGVTDLKAAIRYIRYNEGNSPGSMNWIFSFGMSGGGAQSALLGATGNSELYTPYLENIGAVSGVSDAVAGSMCWCPITNLDYADAAYEWNLGVTRTDLDAETQELSDGLAEAFALYINQLGLTDESGKALLLKESEEGIYQAGTYYDYLKNVIEESLNNFLADTEFPYNAQESDGFGPGGMRGQGGMNGGQFQNGRKMDRMDGELPELADGEAPEQGADGMPELPGGEAPETSSGGMTALENGVQNDFGGMDGKDMGRIGNTADESGDDITRTATGGGLTLSGTYETPQDYIDALNAETQWVIYDSETNTATITSIADFVKTLKNASKSVGAFDDLNAAQGENILFGYGDGEGAHFDVVMAEFLSADETYGEAYAEDLQRQDDLGNTVEYRVNMYNPMYYLCDCYGGCQTSNVAKYWRIRTGINQGDTALTTEVNLALALESYGADVDFETVWGQGHTQAERTGDSASNFVAWVNACAGGAAQE